jgi:hypothetical protein
MTSRDHDTEAFLSKGRLRCCDDLPQVVAVTEKIIQETGLTNRITCADGDIKSYACLFYKVSA